MYSEKAAKREKPNIKKEVIEWILAIGAALILSFLLRTYFFSFACVYSESMEPTLYEKDKIYMYKFTYRPKRGDIVAFLPEFDKNTYIKRVIAIEGDRLYIDFCQGEVFLNNQLIEEKYLNGPTIIPEKYIKDLMDNGKYSKDTPLIIEKDYVFVMGDNRPKSFDSRGFGPISVKSIKGKAVFRIWPFDRFGSLYKRIEEK